MTAPPPGELLTWDTEFFGRRIARVTLSRVDAEGLERLQRWARDQAVDCLYWLAEADDVAGVRAAEDAGFRLTDLRVTLSRALAPADADAECPDAAVDACAPDDVATLAGIARSAHRQSRFYSDPRFPRERCDALYETWIRNSCEGWADVVLVARDGARPAGYISCHRHADGTGQIGLVAVAAEARGRAFGRRLVRGSLRWFADRGLARARVVTQARNTAALQLYEGHGFRVESVRPWLHLWPDHGADPDTP